MSATGRGVERIEFDDYPTPHYCTRRLLEAVPLPPGRWLEPSAGRGDVLWACTAAGLAIDWTVIEVRPECAAPLRALAGPHVVIADFLSLGCELVDLEAFDVIIGNPPYGLRTAFVERLVEGARPDAWIALLLPLSHAGGRNRREWLAHRAPDLYVVPDRPPFRAAVGESGTDAEVYAWFVWPPWGHFRTAGATHWLALTSALDREPERLFATALDLSLPESLEDAA